LFTRAGLNTACLGTQVQVVPSRKADKSSKCMFYSRTFLMFPVWNLMCWNLIYGPSNMFKNPFGLKIFPFDMTKWLGVSLGVISNTGEFRGILSKVREPQMDFVGRWKFLKPPLFFHAIFQCLDFSFGFKYLPQNKVKCEKHKKKHPAFWWCCTTKKNHVHDVFCLFLFAFRGF